MKQKLDAWIEVENFYKNKNIEFNGNNESGAGAFSTILQSNGNIDVSEFPEEKMDILKYIEERTRKIYQFARDDYIPNDMPIKTVDGVKIVEFDEHTHCHVAQPNMETMQSFAKGGFLATEWFGYPESEREAPYCTFTRSARYVDRGLSSAASKYKVMFFFDTNNNIMQNMLTHDFFGYYYAISQAKNQEDLDRIKSQYGKLAIVYDYFIENQEGTRNMRKVGVENYHKYKNTKLSTSIESALFDFKEWHAILGGIPPQFVNGIQIKSDSELNNHIEEILELFPNATIFNEYNMVISHSNQKFTEEEIMIAKREKEKAIEEQIKKEQYAKKLAPVEKKL